MNRCETRGDDGFTLVELVVALLVLAIVMAAFGPAFIGMMRASASTDQRSEADSLAVAASENVRALPYYQVGYSSAHGNPTYCTGSNPVQTDVLTPMDTMATQTMVQNIKYWTDSCVYWVNASDGSSEAYKESVVTVLWGSQKQYKYIQTSAIYPGGESKYTSTGQADNFTPSTVAQATSPPPVPTVNSATPYQTSPTDTVSPQTIVMVDWQPVTFTYPVLYQIEYWAGAGVGRPAQPSVTQVISGAPDGLTPAGLEYQVSGLTPGTTYNFDVLSLSGSQNPLIPSSYVTTTTASPSSGSCQINSINITPIQPQVDNQGNPTNFTYLAITVNATSTCAGLSVEYGLNNSSGQPQAPLTQVPLTWNGASFNGQATQSTWARKTYGFVVYQNGTATTLEALVTPCKLNGGGQCS
jgi:prepilin-type N-terminal cleavage/methylation domain-containing protein